MPANTPETVTGTLTPPLANVPVLIKYVPANAAQQGPFQQIMTDANGMFTFSFNTGPGPGYASVIARLVGTQAYSSADKFCDLLL